ncbi:MAG: hypothetical protein AAGA93_23315 [Actinomycetota bacterium]
MLRQRLVPVLVGLLLLVGCADRPSPDALADAIATAAAADPTVDLTPEQASCIANRLLDSGLSDTTLDGLTENFDNPEVLSAEVDRVEPTVAEAAAACVAADG